MVLAPGDRHRLYPDGGLSDIRGEVPDPLEHSITRGGVQLSEHRTQLSSAAQYRQDDPPHDAPEVPCDVVLTPLPSRLA